MMINDLISIKQAQPFADEECVSSIPIVDCCPLLPGNLGGLASHKSLWCFRGMWESPGGSEVSNTLHTFLLWTQAWKIMQISIRVFFKTASADFVYGVIASIWKEVSCVVSEDAELESERMCPPPPPPLTSPLPTLLSLRIVSEGLHW